MIADPIEREASRHLVDLATFQPGTAVERLGGRLMLAEPQSAAHYTAIQKTARALAAAFGDGWDVRTQGPIELEPASEPAPDVVVVPGRPDDYTAAHPRRPTLTVEVAEVSLALDRDDKASLYARAGLAEYWIVNLVDRVLEVYQKPAAHPPARFGFRYTRCEIHDESGRVSPLAAPTASVAVAALLPVRDAGARTSR